MLRQIHALPGLIAAVLVSMLALTGAVLSVDPVLERARSSVPATDEISVADLTEGVLARYPNVQRIVRKASGEVVVYYFDADVPRADVVDPRTGAALAPYAPSAFKRWMTDLHRSFLLGDKGRAAAGLGALAMLVLAVSGAIMLADRLGGWQRILGRIRGSGTQRLHAEAGRLAVVMLLLTSLTGSYMSLTTFGFMLDGMDAEPAFPAAVEGGAPMPVGHLPALMAVDLTDLRELTFPYAGDPSDAYGIITAHGSAYVDQATGAMLGYLPHGFTRQLYETIYMLHTGEGLWWLGLLLGISALAVPAMTATGIAIWLKRRRGMPRIESNCKAWAADTVILVGSEGNTTWGFAKTLHDALAKAGHRVHTAPMNQFMAGCRSAQRMVILTATYGDGSAPASARQFLARLDKTDDAVLPVAVLGFGDRQFPRFCQFAKDVDAALSARGWPQLHPLHTIDRQCVQAFARWGTELGTRIGTPLTLQHVPVRPRTVSLQLIERIDYGADVQATTAVLRLAAEADANIWKQPSGNGLLSFEAGDLLGIIPPGSPLPRFYSLASSSSDGILEICVRKHPGGLCSGFLHALQPGDTIDAFIRPNPAFRPVGGRAPVILVGAGTGIGPLAGFIRGNVCRRPIHLYFGARDPQSDYLYEAELRTWLSDKRLTRLVTAFSRATDRAYVQDRIASDADAVRTLVARGAQIVVCGGRQMAQGLARVVEEVVKPLGLDVMTLKMQGRYVEDVY
jgi:sulfite reductase (NADPH) flavoprotein alpha-component